ncbi:glycosyltransferase [Cryptosporangium phraense]|uniref:Glycosyltransferase n=1 Tax=Cryptosporangium phraense TaxID=2593070 RepID=A0A545AVC0_9ACTN|nr:glycosyltransferase [Cryptosporangium phraense]TQS45254.1 glycosyltransferase [Cryptosporangium phraense]
MSDLLAAVLIVRNEAAALPGCLASLRGVADRVLVHDTGSVDGTPVLAERLGATVTRGLWDDDFAAARNEAHRGCPATWVLTIDADQRYTGDPDALRALLRAADADVFRVEIDNAHDESPYTHAEGRLYRSGTVRWQGRVHERLVGSARIAAAPRPAIVLTHEGYASAELRRAKSARNVGLAHRALDELLRDGDPADRDRLATTLLDLGRSLIGAGRRQDAVDTFEVLREEFPGTPQWLEGTDFLARLVLAGGLDEVCLVLVGQLRDAGAPAEYCAWLEAQALAQLGDAAGAARLLDGVTEVVDTAGRRYSPAALNELRKLVGRLRARG